MRKHKHVRSRLRDLREQTARWTRRLDDVERQIYNACEHEWVVDHASCAHRTERVCAHCYMAPGTYPRPTQPLDTSGAVRRG